MIALLAAFIFGGMVLIAHISETEKAQVQVPTRKCQTIPTDDAAWGLSVQSTPSGLYFCYQQGAGQNMTEVVCTPMKECP